MTQGARKEIKRQPSESTGIHWYPYIILSESLMNLDHLIREDELWTSETIS